MERRELIKLGVGTLLTTAVEPTIGRVYANGAPEDQDVAASARYNSERRFLSSSCGRISYIDRGSGDAVLFLHGFPLSSFQWRGAIDRLSADRRCIAPDLLGLGYSEVATDQSVAPAAQVEMIRALLDGVRIQEVDVIANDSGGAVAQLFITKYRKRVRTLLLTNCDVETDSPPATLLPVIDLARRGLYADLWLEPWLHHKAEARSSSGLGGMCYSRAGYPSDAALEQYLGPLVASAERKALVNRYAASLTPDPLRGLEARLRTCTVPTSIVWGTGDTIFSQKNPDYLASVLPQIMGIQRLNKAKLFFPEEYPNVIAKEAQALWELTSVRFLDNA